MKNFKRHLAFSAITAAMCIAGVQPGLALTENARACSVADAAIVHAVPADWPTADWGHNFSGTAVVKISLDLPRVSGGKISKGLWYIASGPIAPSEGSQ
jgi:hypothetical protein